MTGYRNLFLLLTAILIETFASVSSIAQTAAKTDEDVRFLLVRRAGEAGVPEKNYYELAQTAHFLEPQLFSAETISHYNPSPRNYGFDVVTELSVRYGVYQAWKVHVIAISDSEKAPISTKDSAYVLVYPRNPDWKFCAKRYSVVSTNDARKINYTDFQDGREYTIELTRKWPRPWQIYEVKVLTSNAFGEIWQASQRTDQH